MSVEVAVDTMDLVDLLVDMESGEDDVPEGFFRASDAAEKAGRCTKWVLKELNRRKRSGEIEVEVKRLRTMRIDGVYTYVPFYRVTKLG